MTVPARICSSDTFHRVLLAGTSVMVLTAAMPAMAQTTTITSATTATQTIASGSNLSITSTGSLAPTAADGVVIASNVSIGSIWNDGAITVPSGNNGIYGLNNNTITLQFANNADRDAVMDFLRRNGNEYTQQAVATTEGSSLRLNYTDVRKQEIQSYAVNQNLTTLRNRINELGVAEALVQTQGRNRIVVELPGVQDTAEAKRVLGRTANLEFRLVSDLNDQYIDPYTGQLTGPVPPGTEAFAFESLDSGRQILLNRSRILTGERVQNASSGFSQDTGGAEVNITLDAAGGKLMADATRNAVGKRMAVLFIENKQRISYVTDENGTQTEVRTPYTESVVINAATIQAVLGSQFRITGLDSPQEASELALMLRAGALAAPMYFVEERVIGPSLGQENIDKGVLSTQIGFILVAIWMVVFFRLFGLIANFALVFNLAMILTVMSWIGASLTLPGIAGIVITIGMAVDANVLICERIR